MVTYLVVLLQFQISIPDDNPEDIQVEDRNETTLALESTTLVTTATTILTTLVKKKKKN